MIAVDYEHSTQDAVSLADMKQGKLYKSTGSESFYVRTKNFVFRILGNHKVRISTFDELWDRHPELRFTLVDGPITLETV